MQDENQLPMRLIGIEISYYPEDDSKDLYCSVSTGELKTPVPSESVREYCERHDGLDDVLECRPYLGSLGKSFVTLSFCYMVDDGGAECVVYVVYDYRREYPYAPATAVYVSLDSEGSDRYESIPIPDPRWLAEMKIGELTELHKKAISKSFPAMRAEFYKIISRFIR